MNSSRRRFLQSASLLGAAGTFGSLSLPLWSSPAFAKATDYKALVCVFLYGANDNGNTLIPYATGGHAAYVTQRGGLYTAGGVAIPRERLDLTRLSGVPYALNPGMPKLRQLFNQGKAAIVANVGPLLEPTAYVGGNLVKKNNPGQLAALPPKLRSHNDQQAFWQSLGVEGTSTGWGGRFADVFVRDQSNPPDDAIFSSISTFGEAVFSAGAATVGYQVTTSGAVPISAVTGASPLFGLSAADASGRVFEILTRADSGRRFERDLNALRARSIAAEATLSDALAGIPDNPPERFQGPLGAQLGMVLKLIKAGKAMGLKRQIFHVGLGGFDMHDGLVGYTDGVADPGTHEAQLGLVDTAIADFYAQLGALQPQVTTFTASDFGRTINPNSDGSDHAWGSHHFVVGGSVLGGQIYGRVPDFDPSDAAWMPRGVLVPEVATQQVAYTLGSWFGLSAAQLDLALPSIDAFPAPKLGFLG